MPFRTAPTNSEGTATTTSAAPSSASARSAVARTLAGTSTSVRYQAFRRPRAMDSTISGSRTHRRTASPRRPKWAASAVPQLPPPISASVIGRSSRALSQAALGAGGEPGEVVAVARHHDGCADRASNHGRAPIAEGEGAEGHARRRGHGGQRYISKGYCRDQPHERGGQDGPRHQGQERAQAGGHALAAAEAEEDRPAVADDGRHRARGRDPRLPAGPGAAEGDRG